MSSLITNDIRLTKSISDRLGFSPNNFSSSDADSMLVDRDYAESIMMMMGDDPSANSSLQLCETLEAAVKSECFSFSNIITFNLITSQY